MNGKTSTLIAAIAIGFLVGVAVAMKFGGWLAWVLGPLAGGIVGYLSYEFKVVLGAIPKAWAKVAQWKIPNEEFLCILQIIGLVLWVMAQISIIGFGAVIPFWVAANMVNEQPALNGLNSPLVPLVLLLIGGSMVGLVGCVLSVRENPVSKCPVRTATYTLIRFNFFALYFYWPIRGLIWFVPRIPKLIATVALFFWHLFRLIHSQSRLIAGSWAFIGVASWLLTDAFWACGIFAILGGVVSREIIGKRILKTIPFPAHSST